MKRAAALGGLLCVMSGGAAAEDGLSLEVLAGHAWQESEASRLQSIRGDDLSYGVRLSYRFYPYLGLELSWFDYGEAEDQYRDSFGDSLVDTLAGSAFSLALEGVLPLSDRLALNARAGLARWEYELSRTDTAFPLLRETVTDDGQDPFYGIGARYAVSDRVLVGLEYAYLQMDVAVSGVEVDHVVETLSLSLGYRF